jgi:protease I
MKALIISADNFEDVELLVPFYRLKEEGIKVHVASMSKGKIKGRHGYEVEADKSFAEVNPDDYDVLVVPGGKAPEVVRRDEGALRIVRDFFKKNKPVSAVCHGPQVLISAGVMQGKHATSYKSVAGELKEAKAIYKDGEVVVDGNLVTSRQPSDLPAFMRETMRMLKRW